MKSFTLFNNKERVGKTTTTYHVAHVLARSEQRVVMLDFDPQASLTAMFLDDDQLANCGRARPMTAGRSPVAST